MLLSSRPLLLRAFFGCINLGLKGNCKQKAIKTDTKPSPTYRLGIILGQSEVLLKNISVRGFAPNFLTFRCSFPDRQEKIYFDGLKPSSFGYPKTKFFLVYPRIKGVP